MKRACALLGLILSGFVQAEPAVDGSAFSHAVIGGVFPYVAQAGDRLSLLGSRFGVSSSILARENHLDRTVPLRAGD
ncbi:MAG: hypothetical protein P4L70_00355, partial [Parasulfuritortus sp.]|nr:hypothetical protein [Parasulfuritortus sp.]